MTRPCIKCGADIELTLNTFGNKYRRTRVCTACHVARIKSANKAKFRKVKLSKPDVEVLQNNLENKLRFRSMIAAHAHAGAAKAAIPRSSTCKVCGETAFYLVPVGRKFVGACKKHRFSCQPNEQSV